MDRKQKHLLVLLLTLLCTGAVFIATRRQGAPHPRGEDPKPHPNGNGSVQIHSPGAQDHKPRTNPPPITSEIYKELTDHGWDDLTAQRAAQLNGPWLSLLAKENPKALQRQRKLLAALGAYPQWNELLFQHPEAASLLATAEKPQPIAKVLQEAGEDYGLVAGLYVRHIAPVDAIRLTNALEDNRDLICSLIRRGLVGSEVLFLFDRSTEAGQEYQKWLREILRIKLNANEDKLASLVHLLLNQGPEILKKMEQDESFRRDFRQKLWPRLTRVVAKTDGMFEFYLDEPHVWKILQLPEGEKLLRDWGALAPRLLYGEEGYPKELHSRVIPALIHGDNLSIGPLVQYRKEVLFQQLLKRPLSPETMTGLLRRLNAAGDGYRKLLENFVTLSDKALSEEVGPPPSGVKTWIPLYFTYYAGKKLVQGRRVSGMDWLVAVADPVAFSLPLAKGISKGHRLGAAAFNATLKRTGLALARRRFSRNIINRLDSKDAEPEAMRWSVTALLSQAQAPLRQEIQQSTTYEITRPVELFFRYSHQGSASLRRWGSLEARLYMRRDARSFLALGKTAAGQSSVQYLNRLAEAILPHNGNRSRSDVGSEPLIEAIQTEHRRLEAWRKNVSTWWLMNAGRMIPE